MKKILYIEDELDYNIIIRCFDEILTTDEKTALKESENDDEAILETIQNNRKLEIVSNFVQAIENVERNLPNYDLLIVDRNLFGDGTKYVKHEIPGNLHPQYDKTFDTREGDFLFHLVANKGYDIDKKFFFLTGNDDDIKNHPELKPRLSENFKRCNIILKTTQDIEKIRKIVAEIDDRLNSEYLDILRQINDEEVTKKFLKILKNKDDEARISDNLKEMRTIYEIILNECMERIPDMKSRCKEKKERTRWLERNKYTNTIQRNFFPSIYFIGSTFGAHWDDKEALIYPPTVDTVNANFYALKDVIRWFGIICQKNPKN